MKKKKKIYRPEDDPLEGFMSLSTPMKLWRFARPLLIWVISIVIVAAIVIGGYNYVMDRFYRPMNGNDTTPVTVTIKTGSSTSAIAKVLYDEQEDGSPGENQLIKNKAVFKVYVDFTGMGSKLRSGTYTFDRTMTIPELVDALAAGDGTVLTTQTFRLTEGMTVEDMAKSLVEQGVLQSMDKFLKLCSTMEGLTTNELLIDEAEAEGRTYALEGYLFPDTYEVYTNSSEKTIIDKLTNRFYGVITTTYILRAEELGMTLDEVITLASIIEKEAKSEDFAKVSAVFHNRLAEGMSLQSDATVQYVLGSNKLIFDENELATESPYNTYINAGLPIGPICNPGRAAIVAALYPDEEMLEGDYLYFCLAEPETGRLVFAKTLKEHNENVAAYKALWEETDRANGN